MVDACTRLDAVSAPRLNFPAGNNALLAPMLQFNGPTVDGVAHAGYPSLTENPSRY